jgi:predicted phage-related endonuclease
MTALAPEYGSPAWVADRANYVGASDVPLMLGVSEYGGPLDLYRIKKGLEVIEPTDAMARGHIYEEAICRDFLLNFPQFTLEKAETRAHPKGDFLRATPDGIIVDSAGRRFGIEAKLVTPRFIDKYGESGTDHAPLDKVAQGQTQCEVFDLPAVYIVVNFGFELRWYFIERDHHVGERIVDEAHDFMFNHVKLGIPPEPTVGQDTYQAITRTYRQRDEQVLEADEATLTLIEEFADVKATKKAAEEREEQLKAELAVRIGSAYGIDAGIAGRVLWPEQAGKVTKDFDGLVRELKVPDDVVQKFTRAGAPFRTMRYYPPPKRK